MTLLTVTSIDANDNLIPICWALVLIEDEMWWYYCLSHFKKAFQLDSGKPRCMLSKDVTFINDRDKKLIGSVENLFPFAQHAYCCQHLVDNIYRKFGKEARNAFWLVARARSRRALSKTFEEIKSISPEVYDYLSKIPPKKWAFLHFPASRFGHDTSNIAESLNNIWDELRNLPLLLIIDKIN